MKKKNGQKRLVVFTVVNLTIAIASIILSIWYFVNNNIKPPLYPAAAVLYALVITRIILDYFHERIKNKKSRLYLQSVIDSQNESIESMQKYIQELEFDLEHLEKNSKIIFFNEPDDYQTHY